MKTSILSAAVITALCIAYACPAFAQTDAPAPAPAAAQPAPAPAAAQPAPAPVAAQPVVVAPQAGTPVYVLQQPGAAPAAPAPMDIMDPKHARHFPKRVSPNSSQSPPPGYVEVMRARKGLVIAGSVLFGVSYGSCLLLAGIDSDHLVLMAPFVGPIIYAAKVNNAAPDEDYYNDDAALSYYSIMASIMQIGGVAMLITGLAVKKKHWLRWDLAKIDLQLTPMATAKSTGLHLSGSF